MKEQLCSTPNKYAEKPKVVFNADSIMINGYNAYKIKNNTVYPNRHNNKYEFISKYLESLDSKSVLDLGCANGMYSMAAALNDSKLVTSVDLDSTHLNIISKIKTHLNLTNINVLKDNVETVEKTHDIVLALALIHWVYSCTSVKFKSLDKVIKWFSELTNEYLIIEWVDAKNDTNVNWFKHTEYNQDVIEEEYTKANFDKALIKHFNKVEHIGDTNQYRKLYVAYK